MRAPPLFPLALPARAPAAAGGFTLVELLLALTLGALLLGYSVRFAADWLPRYWQRMEAEALAGALQLARSEAIKRGHRVALCPSLDGRTCSGSQRWESGYVTFDDVDDDALRDPGEGLVRVASAPGHQVSVRGNRPVADYVSYTALGTARLRSGALQMGTFTVCRPGLDAIQVVLANGGRPRIQEVTVRCP